MKRRIERDDGVEDVVAIEEPLEIRLRGEPVAVTMRTPGADDELALGFLFGEGLIDGPAPVGSTPDLAANIVDVDAEPLRALTARRFYASSSCGVCGKGALEEVAALHEQNLKTVPGSVFRKVPRGLIASLPDRLRQPGFEATGGMHATGLFDADGGTVALYEDVGRHNAMDKVVGWALREGRVPLSEAVLCVSGRIAFELVQKAAMAGAPILVGVGAPTSLAVDLALDRGLTLCGFARGGSVNVYTHAHRLA